MKSKKTSLLASSAIALTVFLGTTPLSSVVASDVKYSYAQFRYIFNTEADEVDGDGFWLGGSYRINPDFYLLGDFVKIDYDNDLESQSLGFGAGYIHPLNTKWDANVSFSLIKSEVSFRGRDEDETGFALRGGARGMVTPQIEARAFLNYVDVVDDDTFITLAGDYFFTPNLSAGISVDIGGDANTMSVGGRYYF